MESDCVYFVGRSLADKSEEQKRIKNPYATSTTRQSKQSKSRGGPCFLHTSSRFPRCCEPTIMDQGPVSDSNRATLFCALAKRKHLITRSTSINSSADRGYSGHPTLVFARGNKAIIASIFQLYCLVV
jgi:hypothetical protein